MANLTLMTLLSVFMLHFHGAALAEEAGRCSGGGSVYTRWGRTTCGDQSTALYKGYAASSHHNDGYGGGVNYLCVPEVPEWANQTKAGYQGGAKLYGTEYQFHGLPFSTANNGGKTLLNNDVPCVSCFAPTRSAQVMIPARINCPTGWTKEYGGFLVSSNLIHKNNKDYICVDEAPEVRDGGSANVNPALIFFVETTCSGLPCPKYGDGFEVACVVCSF